MESNNMESKLTFDEILELVFGGLSTVHFVVGFIVAFVTVLLSLIQAGFNIDLESVIENSFNFFVISVTFGTIFYLPYWGLKETNEIKNGR